MCHGSTFLHLCVTGCDIQRSCKVKVVHYVWTERKIKKLPKRQIISYPWNIFWTWLWTSTNQSKLIQWVFTSIRADMNTGNLQFYFLEIPPLLCHGKSSESVKGEERRPQRNDLRKKGLAFVSQPRRIRNDSSLSCLPGSLAPPPPSHPRPPFALICNVNSFGNQAGAALVLSECLHVRGAPGTH